MNRKFVRTIYAMLVLFAVAALAACGGGGGGGGSSSSGAATALTVAEQVSIVDAQQSPSRVQALKIGKLYLAPSDIPANSDYYNDHQEVYVHERSAEAFELVNEILCAIAQSKYDEMLNAGDYKAQIDMNLCSSGGDDAGSAGESSQNQSSGSTAPDYEMWTVNSSRADADSPHIVKVWIHEEGDEFEPAMLITAKATITEGVSDTNPFGLFTINFSGHPESDTSETMFKGYLKTEVESGQILLKLAEQGYGDFAYSEQAVLNRSADGSTGSGSASITESFDGAPHTKNFDMAYDSSNFLRSDGADSMCFDRTNFEETAWRYGLYDSSGSRVTRNSGFNIKIGDAYGWIGYYGLWFPDSVTLSDGDTVYKVEYGEGGETATPYTVVAKGGRLKKHTRNTNTLGGIKNIPLDMWTDGGGFHVKWNGSAFVKFAQQNPATYMWEDIAEVPLDLTALPWGDLNFWSQSLGGEVRIKLDGCVWNEFTFDCSDPGPSNATEVIFFKEDVVFPGDSVPAAFTCYDNCPKYSVDVGGIKPSDSNYSYGEEHAYTFDSSSSDMILKESGNSLIWADDGSGQNQWGAMSGPLFEASEANLALLACDDWNANGIADDGTCGWKAWSELSEYYTWETGGNSWNQFTALKDSGGSVLEFQAPLQVQYVHSAEAGAPDFKYDGTTFYLEYSGFGNLWGIPGACVDMDTGEATSCGPDTRWVPEFGIADGSDVYDGTNYYLVKALEKEQRMTSVDVSNCSSLTLTTYDLPSIDLWEDPDIGSEPAVTNAPAVIGGVVQ
ncbi:MAG: hypothetical protein HZA16_15170 [Nitrospirae bacterium]|nr:hypothetical protein [Nitrospirota bacterium]